MFSKNKKILHASFLFSGHCYLCHPFIFDYAMKHLTTAVLTLFCVSAAYAQRQDYNEIYLADPTVYAEDGIYYMTGTGQPEGFAILESSDLVHWKAPGPDPMILRKGTGTFGNKWFWAPQFFKDGDVYYLAYTADEQIAIACSDVVSGPFLQDVVGPVDASAKNIDPFIFKDDDGKYYLYHVRFGHGNFIWVAELDPGSGHLVKETLRKCLECTEDWEHTSAYQSDPIMEGPSVIKVDGIYYLFYSANHYMSPDYAVGYVWAETPFGPWHKNPDNPVIHRSIVGENGSGHGDIFIGPDGRYWYVYHVHNSDVRVHPRKTRIIPLSVIETGGILSFRADTAGKIIPVQEH